MIEILFWVFWIIGLVVGGYGNRDDYFRGGAWGIGWLLLLFLGLAVFHNPLAK